MKTTLILGRECTRFLKERQIHSESLTGGLSPTMNFVLIGDELVIGGLRDHLQLVACWRLMNHKGTVETLRKNSFLFLLTQIRLIFRGIPLASGSFNVESRAIEYWSVADEFQIDGCPPLKVQKEIQETIDHLSLQPKKS